MLHVDKKSKKKKNRLTTYGLVFAILFNLLAFYLRSNMLIISILLWCSFAVAGEQQCVSPWLRNSSWTASPFHGALCNAPEREATNIAATAGSIPAWLKGTLFRNVPAQYTFGGDDVRHWFDGMGMFHTLELDPSMNSITSASRFANTTSFVVMNATSQYDYTGFGTYPHPGPLDSNVRNHSSSGKGIVTNNDVSIVALAGRFFATTDRAGFIEFDPLTLETLTSTRDFEFFDNLSTASAKGLGLAHGPYDADTGEYFNYVADAMMSVVGGPTTVYIYSINATAQFHNRSLPWARKTVGVIATSNNTYAHSMGVTEHFVVWIEQRGLTVSELDLAIGSTIMDAMRESPEPSVMRIVDRASARVHTVPMNTDFGCMFHSGNTFEDVDGSVVYDMVAYPNCTGYQSLTIEGLLLRPDKVMPNGRFTRCRVAPGFESVSCGTILPHTYSSFPWYNKNFHKRPYRYAYTTDIARVHATDEANWNTTAIINKIDLTTNQSVVSYSRRNFLFTEALFIPEFPGNVDPRLEDAGALLVVAFDVDTSLTDVIALNATNFEVLFVVALPFAIPLHFHGIFCGPVPSSPSEQQFCLWN
jgi:beta,beta-carotene 9',10'-dioxygenase